MAKVVKTVAAVVGVAALVIATGGAAAFGISIAAAASSVTIAGLGITASGLFLASAGLSAAASLLAKRPKAPSTSDNAEDRLKVSIDPRTPRKFAFGRTAMATDIRDQELNLGQEYLDRFIVVASHAVEAIEEIWFDDKLAWSATGGILSEYAGYLTVQTRTEGSAGNAIVTSPRMGDARRYTGLAYVYLRYKLTGNSKKTTSPFQQAVPSRVTIVGKCAKVYDPRFDSTVPGGSGPQRANDQSTWQWDDGASRNPALQLLWYLLGWRINGKLAVGKGIPPARINLESFITAANLCDEPVTLAAGGTEPRYRSDGLFSEADPTATVIDQLKASMNADLDDVDGRLRLLVLHNDLATPIADFSEDDVLGEFTWEQSLPLDDQFNVVRGTFIDPSSNSLYQAVDYPEVRIDSPDGIDRIEPVDLQTVQSASQAQRLAKQRVARMLYSGTFTATFGHRAWKVQRGDVVRLSFYPLGWTNKLFRVIDTAVQVDGQVPMTLKVEHPDIYLWDSEEAPAIAPVAGTTYDPALDPIYTVIADFAGASNAIVYIYKRATSTPALPTATATYTFGTGAISGLNNGWSAAPPPGTDPLYVAAATASSSDPTDNIPATEWSTPVVLGGGSGLNGADGLNSASVFLYQRTTGSAPTLPSANVTYTFATGVASGANNGWSQTIPSTGGVVLWVTIATAISTAASDTILPGEWSAARRLAQDGESAYTGYLTNETHTLPADAGGNVTSYAGANGSFVVLYGATDVSSTFTLSTQANPQGLAVSYAGNTYSITGGLDAGEPSATLTIRATGSGAFAGVVIDKTFSLAKSVAGAAGSNGASPPLISLSGTHATFRFSGAGAPQTQSTTITATRQNTSGTSEWRLLKADGSAITGWTTAAGLVVAGWASTAPSDDQITVSESFFASALGAASTTGLIYEARISTAPTIVDRWTLTRISDGASGASAFSTTLTSMTRNGGTFTAIGSGFVLAQARSVELFPQGRVSLVYRGGDLHIGLANPALSDTSPDNFLSLSTPGWWGVGADWKRHRSYASFLPTGINPAVGQVIEVAHIGTEIRGFINGVDVGAAILTGVPVGRSHQLVLIIANAGDFADSVTFSRAGAPGTDGADGVDGSDGADGFTIAPASAAFSIACASDGTPKAGEFNKVITFVLRQGSGADLAGDAATSFAAPTIVGCTAALSGTRGQTLTISGIAADSAYVDVVASRSGTPVATVRVTLTKAKDGISPSPQYAAVQISGGVTNHPDKIVLTNGQSITAEARYRTLGDTAAGTANSLQVQIRPAGGAWSVMSGGSNLQNNGPGDPVTLGVSAATFTNTSGVTQSYELRTVIVNNGGGTERPELCFLRPYA